MLVIWNFLSTIFRVQSRVIFPVQSLLSKSGRFSHTGLDRFSHCNVPFHFFPLPRDTAVWRFCGLHMKQTATMQGSFQHLNRGSIELEHNYLMLLPLFKLTTCFGLFIGPSSGHKIYRVFQKDLNIFYSGHRGHRTWHPLIYFLWWYVKDNAYKPQTARSHSSCGANHWRGTS